MLLIGDLEECVILIQHLVLLNWLPYFFQIIVSESPSFSFPFIHSEISLENY